MSPKRRTLLTRTRSGENLDYTPAHNKDFGILDYDCRFEGLFAYMLYIFTQLWGFVWLYDLRYLMLNPSVNTIQYMIYYKIFVYFIGFLISIVIFFPNQHLYTEVLRGVVLSAQTLTFVCYIKRGVVFNAFVNAPKAIYILTLFYVHARFGRPELIRRLPAHKESIRHMWILNVSCQDRGF